MECVTDLVCRIRSVGAILLECYHTIVYIEREDRTAVYCDRMRLQPYNKSSKTWVQSISIGRHEQHRMAKGDTSGGDSVLGLVMVMAQEIISHIYTPYLFCQGIYQTYVFYII